MLMAARRVIPAQPGVLGEIVVSAPHLKDHYDRLWLTDREAVRDTADPAPHGSARHAPLAPYRRRRTSRCPGPRLGRGSDAARSRHRERTDRAGRGRAIDRECGRGPPRRRRRRGTAGSSSGGRRRRDRAGGGTPRARRPASDARGSREHELPLAAIFAVPLCRPTSATTPRSIARGCRAGPSRSSPVRSWAPRDRARDRRVRVSRSCGCGALVAAGHDVRTLQRRPSGVAGATDFLGSVTDAASRGPRHGRGGGRRSSRREGVAAGAPRGVSRGQRRGHADSARRGRTGRGVALRVRLVAVGRPRRAWRWPVSARNRPIPSTPAASTRARRPRPNCSPSSETRPRCVSWRCDRTSSGVRATRSSSSESSTALGAGGFRC